MLLCTDAEARQGIWIKLPMLWGIGRCDEVWRLWCSNFHCLFGSLPAFCWRRVFDLKRWILLFRDPLNRSFSARNDRVSFLDENLQDEVAFRELAWHMVLFYAKPCINTFQHPINTNLPSLSIIDLVPSSMATLIFHARHKHLRRPRGTFRECTSSWTVSTTCFKALDPVIGAFSQGDGAKD